MDHVLLNVLRDMIHQLPAAFTVALAFAKTNPLTTALLVAGLLIGGGGSGRRAGARAR